MSQQNATTEAATVKSDYSDGYQDALVDIATMLDHYGDTGMFEYLYRNTQDPQAKKIFKGMTRY